MERVSPELRIMVYLLQRFINIRSLLLRKRFRPVLSKQQMRMQQVCQTDRGGIEKGQEV